MIDYIWISYNREKYFLKTQNRQIMDSRLPIIKTCVFLLTFFAHNNALPQQYDIKEYLGKLPSCPNDTNKVKLYDTIAVLYLFKNDYTAAMMYADSELILSNKINYDEGLTYAWLCKANLYSYMDNLPYSDSCLRIAMNRIEKKGDKNKLAQTYLEMSEAYKTSLHYQPAYDCAFKGLALYSQTGNNCGIGRAWLSIGRIYSYMHNFTEAEKSCKRAMAFFENCNEDVKGDIAICTYYLGRAYVFLDDSAKAETYLLRSNELLAKAFPEDKKGGNYSLAVLYKRLGLKAAARGEEMQARKMYLKSLEKYKDCYGFDSVSPVYSARSEYYQETGDVYILLKEYPTAGYFLQKALEYAKFSGLEDYYRDIYLSLSKLEVAKGNFKSGYEYQKLYNEYNDKVEKKLKTQRIDEFLLENVYRKREDSLANEQLITKTNLATQKRNKNYYLVGIGLIAIIALSIWLNFRKQKSINRLEADRFIKEKNELEMQSLKAQMNPHFMFNCINSIDAFIQTNDKYNATVYLNKFARLIRNVLNSSKENLVPFSKDLETMKLYIELEELRSENKFVTEFFVEDELLNSDIKVPPLIVQPFIENAIIHGLRNRETNDGLLKIKITHTETQLVYLIKDNGIGRQAATTLKTGTEKSYGMKMSQERVMLFNKEKEPSIKITDLFENGKAAGTEVTVNLNIA